MIFQTNESFSGLFYVRTPFLFWSNHVIKFSSSQPPEISDFQKAKKRFLSIYFWILAMMINNFSEAIFWIICTIISKIQKFKKFSSTTSQETLSRKKLFYQENIRFRNFSTSEVVKFLTFPLHRHIKTSQTAISSRNSSIRPSGSQVWLNKFFIGNSIA